MLLESGLHKLDLFIEGVTEVTTSLASPEKPTVPRPVLRRAWMAELLVGSRSLLLRDFCSLSSWKRHSVSSFCASSRVGFRYLNQILSDSGIQISATLPFQP
jgi:hypothetical protein